MTRLFRLSLCRFALSAVAAGVLFLSGCGVRVAEKPDDTGGVPDGPAFAAAGDFAFGLPADAASGAPADDKLEPLVAQAVCQFLKGGHLNRPAVDDELSRRAFRQFFRTLDPLKLYFTKSDLDEFKKSETDLDDQLLRGEVGFAKTVRERFLQRHDARLKWIEEFVGAKHDFTAQESMVTKPEKLEWAAGDDELRERWRQRVKYDLLLHRLGTKPLPEADAKQKVLSRYKSLNKFWHQTDSYDLLELYLSALATSVDPHSSYLSPSSWEDMAKLHLQLHLEGIGARLRADDGIPVIEEIIPGGAAAKDGRLQPEDKIIGVAQGDNKFTDIRDMRLKDAVRLIRGPRGTKVQLEVLPAGRVDRAVYEMIREKVELKEQEAAGEVVDAGKYKVGVIDLPTFYGGGNDDGTGGKSATEDVRRLLKEFKAKKVDAVVLDLRDNGGGLLSEARSLTGLFIDEGPVVQVKAGPRRVQVLDDPEAGTVYDGPLVVLTNRFSASASEILAGAVQDYSRGLVVGDSATFGKGTVQTILPIGEQLGARAKLGALKLTIQQFYRVNGDSTQNRGVVPDIVLPSLKDHLGAGEKELDYALAFDKIEAAKHADYGRVTPEVREALRTRSGQRVKESADFAKLQKQIERLEARRARGSVTLNEKDLKADVGDTAPEEDDPERAKPKKAKDGNYHFLRDFTNNEILKIVEDYVRGK